MIKHILLYIIIISFNSSLWGQELDGSLSKVDRDIFQLHFRFKSSLLEKEYLANFSTLKSINTVFSDNHYLKKLDSISIYAITSPDGVLEHNEQLAYKRSEAIKGYLRWRYPELKKLTINIYSEVSKWSELISYVEQDNTIQSKSKVLEILQNSENNTRATIEWRLKNIDNGVVWEHLAKYHLRYLRSGDVTMSIYMRSDTSPKADTIIKEKQEFVRPQIGGIQIAVTPEDVEAITSNGSVRKPLLAIKTNLLYDALLIPNIKVEVPIGDRFSVTGEWLFPWWLSKDNDKALQILSGAIEGRYWFGDRSKKAKLTGWFAGFYAGGGLYDLQYNSKGYQGEFFIAAGISGGFAHAINKRGNLRMEYSLGVGYLSTNYRHYRGEGGNEYLVWQNDGTYSWIGPTKLEVSLVWMLSFNKKRGAKR